MILKGIVSIIGAVVVTAGVLGGTYWYIVKFRADDGPKEEVESSYQEVHEGGVVNNFSSWMSSLSFEGADAKSYPATEIRVKID
jgi:hypothetical protein